MSSLILPYNQFALDQACRLLRNDDVCAFPTETVYGLGGNAMSSKAIERIYHLKGRPLTNPLIVHLFHTDQLPALITDWPSLAQELATKHWPGPLTLVLPRHPKVPALVSAGLPTIAIRMPAHKVAIALLRESGLPLCAPSANRSEHISPTTAEHVVRSLPQVPLVLDGGPCSLGLESTVVDLTVWPPRLLRPGALPLVSLQQTLPNLALPDPKEAVDPSEARKAPGLMKRHYAPHVPAWLIRSVEGCKPLVDFLTLGNNQASTTRLLEIIQRNVGNYSLPLPEASVFTVGLLTHHPSTVRSPHAVVEQLPNDPMGYAADLYAALYRLEDKKVSCVFVEDPPHTSAWMAIHDRLQRATQPWPGGTP